MKQIVPIAFVVMIAATAPHLSTVLAAAASARVAAGTVKVTLNYKGKGTVDGSHKVWVWLFRRRTSAPTRCRSRSSVDSNGGVATFRRRPRPSAVGCRRFDEPCVRAATPAAVGIPVGIYRAGRRPKSVLPGDAATAG